MLAVFKKSQFSKLCYAQIFSDFAAWLDVSVVAVFLVYYWGVSPYVQASYFVTLATASFFGSLGSAFFADFFSPKKILIMCNVLRVMILLLYFTATSSFILLIYVFFKTFITSFYDPGTQVIIRYSFSDTELPAANSISNTITQIIRILAPMWGGALLIVMKPLHIFIVCSLFYALSTLFLLFLPKYVMPFKLGKNLYLQTFGRFVYNFKFIYTNTLLLVAIGAACLFNFAIFVCESFYVMLFKYLSLPAASVGILFAVVGIGGIVGSLLAGQFLNKLLKLTMMSLNGLIIGIAAVIIALYATKWILFSWLGFMLVSFVFGLASSFFTVAFLTLVQSRTSTDRIGSVSSIVNGLQMIFTVMGPLFGSLLVVHVGLDAPFFMSGILCTIIALCILPFSARLEQRWEKDDIYPAIPVENRAKAS